MSGTHPINSNAYVPPGVHGDAGLGHEVELTPDQRVAIENGAILANSVGLGADTSVASLSPEMIIVMLQRRLSDLDSQIQLETGAIQQAAAESEKISEKMQAVSALRDAMANAQADSTEPVDLNSIAVTVGDKTYDPAWKIISDNGWHDFPNIEYGSDGQVKNWNTTMSREAVSGYVERLQMKQRSLNSGNEMAMVRLQSAIGQRQQAIQLSTNLVNTINQSMMDIIRNTK